MFDCHGQGLFNNFWEILGVGQLLILLRAASWLGSNVFRKALADVIFATKQRAPDVERPHLTPSGV